MAKAPQPTSEVHNGGLSRCCRRSILGPGKGHEPYEDSGVYPRFTRCHLFDHGELLWRKCSCRHYGVWCSMKFPTSGRRPKSNPSFLWLQAALSWSDRVCRRGEVILAAPPYVSASGPRGTGQGIGDWPIQERHQRLLARRLRRLVTPAARLSERDPQGGHHIVMATGLGERPRDLRQPENDFRGAR
jgi:hypothetical protein